MPNNHLLELPFEQQIGQFFFIGLPGTEVDEETRKLIEEVKPGGIIIFGRNVESAEQLRKLTDDARKLIPTAPLVAIDQEGGLVDRLRQVFPPMSRDYSGSSYRTANGSDRDKGSTAR